MRSLPLLLLLAACSGPDTTDKGDKSGDTAADDSGDTGKDTDKGKDTSDTDHDTDTDTDTHPPDSGDTGGPPPVVQTGYTGPTVIAMVVNGASGSGVTDPSSVVLYSPADATSTTISGLTVRGDAIVDCAGDSVFVLESRGQDGANDRILRVKAESGTYTEWAMGSNFKPRDIASVLGGFWVANWGKSRLSTYDAAGTAGPFIELSAYADADGLPEADGLFATGPYVYVTAVRQTVSDGTMNGAKLIEIDTSTNTATRAIDLTGSYPSGRMLFAGDKLHLHVRSTANVDSTLNADGGLEGVAMADFASAGLEVDDSTTGARQTVAYLDPFSVTAWFARVSESGAPSVGAVSLFDGTQLQSWPVSDSVAGIGVAEGAVWTAENPFTGGAGALVARTPADGSESNRITQAGVIRSMALCISGEPPADGQGGGGAR